MSYRNDHDAALARVAALESELAKLRKPEPQLLPELSPEAPEPPPARKRRTALAKIPWREITVGLLMIAPIVIMWQWMRATDQEQHDEGVAKLATCLELADSDAAAAHAAHPDRFTRNAPPSLIRHATCQKQLNVLGHMPRVPDEVARAIHEWHLAERKLDEPYRMLADYYAHRDYEEDDLRGARIIYKRVLPALAARDAAAVDMHRYAIPYARLHTTDASD